MSLSLSAASDDDSARSRSVPDVTGTPIVPRTGWTGVAVLVPSLVAVTGTPIVPLIGSTGVAGLSRSVPDVTGTPIVPRTGSTGVEPSG